MKLLVIILITTLLASLIWACLSDKEARRVTAEVDQYIKDHPL